MERHASICTGMSMWYPIHYCQKFLEPPQIEPMIKERTVVMDIPFKYLFVYLLSYCECLWVSSCEWEHVQGSVCCMSKHVCLLMCVHVDA